MKLSKPCFVAFWLMYFQVVLLFTLNLSQLPIARASSALGNETDMLALLKFKQSISKDPHGILISWNKSIHSCNWVGITCSKQHQRITSLDLHGYNLKGSISPHIGNLTFLRFINLQNNSFHGEIPREVGFLFRLQYLNLSRNILEGPIPVNLTFFSGLRIMSLGFNRLTGEIPEELGYFVKLEALHLSQNNLTGSIPASLGNLSSIRQLSLAYNNLVGNVPDEIGRLKNLSYFTLGPNNLSGMVPLSLFNISSLSTLSLTGNQFHGTLPPNIGLKLPNLQQFAIGGNEFSETIPESFSNASQLQILDIAENDFVGEVPASLGNLPDLWWLGLSNNNLGNNYSSHSLDFITYLTNCSNLEILDLSLNNFGGVLPKSVANLSTQLNKLYLGVNKVYGYIPETLENLNNLIVLGLQDNLFTGVIPTSLGKLQNLQILGLEWNKLSGKIPTSIGNLTQMFQLYLGNNKLVGNIPPDLVNCQNLQYLDISLNRLSGSIPPQIFGLTSLSVLLNLSQNSLTGSLPTEIGKLKNINVMDLSENNLTSEIPETIGDCQSLEYLYLQGNSFQGVLPSSLASLNGIRYLDLSRNKLTGPIPKDMQKLPFLQYLNLSSNNLEGEVPKGVFHNASGISVAGNTKLCGGEQKILQLHSCPIQATKQGKTSRFKVTIIIISCVVAIFILLSIFVFLCWRRKSKKKPSSELSTINFLSKVPYKRLYQATGGFSPGNLIGTGGFGSVYRGIFDEEENTVAIKVLNLQRKGASKSFIAECNAFRRIRHRNLVKILTCCSSMDYNGNEFKALVFEYMPNGSLEKWLHPDVGIEGRSRLSLNLLQRLNIAIDVASALHYLHDQCEEPIIHCDLKSSNVLLDNEMVARVSDFGLARLISATTGYSRSETESSTIGIKVTIGYAAPEYAMGSEASRHGDVYSYGILVLEMFTGKSPTNEMFKDSFNLHKFVGMALPERVMEIVDSALVPNEIGLEEEDHKNIDVEDPSHMNSNNIVLKCLLSVLNIGLGCSEESPKERMNMRDVTRELQHIKSDFLGCGIPGHRMRRR
ncbi:putative receptor-like protein kinase At3g47110 [Ziziphus jujuba]|uniref:Receptor-like protein kinase At3g47110 n=1 Tax=Ziziphus jujuba TaxID=326968 RepID=A0ABM3IEI9_ZIZJJ|nr:putative receptor-like protein kinase At3g47110 [Ziziphus jujuba]